MPTSHNLELWPNITRLYQDAMESSGRHLMLSSASIIQEHTLRAFMDASRACAEALARNAVSVQQQSMGRFMDANVKAGEMMGQALMGPIMQSFTQPFTQSWARGLQPAK